MNQQNGITYRKLPGLSAQGLRIWGLLFLAFGMVLNPSVQKSLASNEVDFIFTSVGLILQLIHFCAIPIFVFLLVEGFAHTTSVKNYAIRIGILALIVELPYNFAMYGKLLGTFTFPNLQSLKLNPVFGMLLALILLYFFRKYSEKSMKNFAIKACLWFMAFVWTQMLHIEYGIAVILLVPIMYFLRNKKMLLIFAGCVAMTLCGFLEGMLQSSWLMNPAAAEVSLNPTAIASYLASAPVAFIMIHFYNGEPGEGNRYINYLAYPVILLATGLLAKFAI
jgi:hypothetical protein